MSKLHLNASRRHTPTLTTAVGGVWQDPNRRRESLAKARLLRRAIGYWILTIAVLILAITPMAGMIGGVGMAGSVLMIAVLETVAGHAFLHRRYSDGLALGAAVGVVLGFAILWVFWVVLSGLIGSTSFGGDTGEWLTNRVYPMFAFGFADGYAKGAGGPGVLLTLWVVLGRLATAADQERRRPPWWWRWTHKWPRAVRRAVLRIKAIGCIILARAGRARTVTFLLVLAAFMTGGYDASHLPHDFTGLPGVVEAYATFVIISILGYLFGVIVARPLGAAQAELIRVRPYLKAAWKPVTGFALGYLGVILLYAGWFWWVAQRDASAFSSTIKVAPLRFGEFVYISASTLVTIGYGGSTIEPKSPLAQALVATEPYVGLFWTMFVFAALTFLLNRTWSRLAENEEHGAE